MKRKIILLTVGLAAVLILSGCMAKTSGTNTSKPSGDQKSGSASGDVTQRTDYTIYYTKSQAGVMGSPDIHSFIIGHPLSEPSAIRANAYLVPWRIDFSQVQRTTKSIIGTNCQTIKEQVVYIDGSIDLNLVDKGVSASELPSFGPVKPSGTVRETVTGEAGVWNCGDSFITSSVNQGSADYIKSVSGEHTANFSDASNLTSLTVSGADIYLDLTMSGKIQFIWPAGTKIEYAPEGTPIPLEPLAPSKL